MSFRLKSVWVALALASVAAQASNDIYVGGGVGAAQYNANQSVATLEAIYHPFRGRDIKPVPT